MSIADKLVTIAENEQKVYNKGYDIGYGLGTSEGYSDGYEKGFEDGKAEGGNTEEAYNKGVEDGKQAEYDAFWNSYQENGNKRSYNRCFAGTSWNSENFKPKYPIILDHSASSDVSSGMFRYFDRNLKKPPLEIHEGDIDFSGKIYTMADFVSNANISVFEMNAVPTILNSMSETFAMTDIGKHILHTIKIGTREETTYGGGTFRCSALQNVSFVEGSVIGTNISFQYCDKLTHDSIMNIISVLKDYSGTGTTRTLTLHANAKAILTDSEKAIATQKGWTIA